MKKHTFFAIFSFLVMTSTCAPRLTNTPTQAKISIFGTSTLPAMPTPSASSPPAIPSLTPLPTDVKLTPECISIESKVPGDLALSGVWVMNNGSAPYIENLDDHTKYAVPLRGGSTELGGTLAVSPDRTHLAYLDDYYDTTTSGLRASKRVLRVIHSSGHEFNMDYWSLDWQEIIGWVDNENLAIATPNQDIWILNPLTGVQRKLRQPAWVPIIDKYTYYWEFSTAYNPTLTWFQYRPDYHTLRLMNIPTGKVAWEKDWGEHVYPDAAWSEDGSKFAIAADMSVIILNGGKQEEELALGQFGYIGIGYFGSDGSFFRFSPNAHKLAFNTEKEGDEGYLYQKEDQLTVWDMDQHRFARVCSDVYQNESQRGHPVWSPDGRFIMQFVRTKPSQKEYKLAELLVDTQEMRAYLLPLADYKTPYPVLWLATP